MSVSSPHRFLGINQDGQVSIVTTKGPISIGHVVLRGRQRKPETMFGQRLLVEEGSGEARHCGRTSWSIASHATPTKDSWPAAVGEEQRRQSDLEVNNSIIGLMVGKSYRPGVISRPQGSGFRSCNTAYR